MSKGVSIAIIGAGITGTRLAQELSGCSRVRVFEKSRGIGGRMSTRRAEDFEFDHGAQYFTAHGPAFRAFLESFLQDGTVATWDARVTSLGDAAGHVIWNTPRYVAVPGMTALCKSMATGLDVARQTRIAHIMQAPAGQWALTGEQGQDCGHFDWVISTAPAEQSVKLMPACFSERDRLAQVRMQGCYSLMIGGVDTTSLEWDAARVETGPLAWIAVNHTKPGRGAGQSILCQSSNNWADTHLEADKMAVQNQLRSAFEKLTGLRITTAPYISLHKWRFAKVATPAGKPCLLDVPNRLGAAGDWCGAGRVEAGFDSAEKLIEKIRSEIVK